MEGQQAMELSSIFRDVSCKSCFKYFSQNYNLGESDPKNNVVLETSTTIKARLGSILKIERVEKSIKFLISKMLLPRQPASPHLIFYFQFSSHFIEETNKHA